MFGRNALVALASAGLVFGSTAAAAAPVAVDEVRVASPVEDAENIRKRGLGLVILVAVVAGVLLIVLSDDDEAISP